MSTVQEMKDAIASIRAWSSCHGMQVQGTKQVSSKGYNRPGDTIARKVCVTYVPGGGVEIEEDEFPVSSAHEKLDAVRRGYRLHQVEAPPGGIDWSGLTMWDGSMSVQYGLEFKAHPHGGYGAIIPPTPKKDRKKDDLDCYRPRPLMSGLPGDWVSK